MKEILLIVFLVTLFYMSIANRMRGYIQVLSIQGIFTEKRSHRLLRRSMAP